MSTKSTPDLTPGFLLGWQLGVAILLLLLPGALLGQWPWELPRKELWPFAGLLGAFALTALLHQAIRRRAWLERLVLAVVSAAAVFCFLLVVLFVMRATSSRTLLLAVLATALFVLPAPFLAPRWRMAGVILLTLAVIAVAALGIMKHRAHGRTADEARKESYVSTHLYNLNVVSYQGRITRPAVRGGGFALFGNHVLLATGDGYLYLIDPRKNSLTTRKLPLRVPLNGEEFSAAVGRKYQEPRNSSEYGRNAPPGVQTWRFRVAGLLAQKHGDYIRVLASHHYWKDKERCFLLRVSAIDMTRDGALAPGADGQWRTVFDTSPCLPIEGKDAKQGKNPFQGEEIGGRMALLDERTILLTVGDLSFSGLESHQILAQDPAVSYGKTVRVDVQSGRGEVFTMGHRNPQGLLRDGDGTLWSTEHGPKGGDELNLLREGVNYGWPRVTYGTDYGTFAWPLNAQQGRHEGYQKPVYSWLPSIGVSNLIRINHELFPGWKNDLLVGSLAMRSLYRLRVEEGRVIFAEPITLDERVRDLVELSDGRILIWTDTASLLEIGPTYELNGPLLFASQCQVCHQIRDGRSHGAGPDLFGIVNKDIAGAVGFSYSPALQGLEGRWAAERLDEFLADPQAVAPGTTMVFEGLADKEERTLLIQYLRKPR